MTPAKHAITESIQLITAIIKLSFKNILRTSIPRAPTALKIPISRFLLAILVAMKLQNMMEAKTAKPIPI